MYRTVIDRYGAIFQWKGKAEKWDCTVYYRKLCNGFKRKCLEKHKMRPNVVYFNRPFYSFIHSGNTKCHHKCHANIFLIIKTLLLKIVKIQWREASVRDVVFLTLDYSWMWEPLCFSVSSSGIYLSYLWNNISNITMKTLMENQSFFFKDNSWVTSYVSLAPRVPL